MFLYACEPVLVTRTSMRSHQPDTTQCLGSHYHSQVHISTFVCDEHTALSFYVWLLLYTSYLVPSICKGWLALLCLKGTYCVDNIFVCSPINALTDSPIDAVTSLVCKNCCFFSFSHALLFFCSHFTASYNLTKNCLYIHEDWALCPCWKAVLPVVILCWDWRVG